MGLVILFIKIKRFFSNAFQCSCQLQYRTYNVQYSVELSNNLNSWYINNSVYHYCTECGRASYDYTHLVPVDEPGYVGGREGVRGGAGEVHHVARLVVAQGRQAAHQRPGAGRHCNQDILNMCHYSKRGDVNWGSNVFIELKSFLKSV